MNGTIANNIGRKIAAIYFTSGNIKYPKSENEVWLLECDEIPGLSGYQHVYFIVMWKNSEEFGRWNVSQIAGWEYLMKDIGDNF